MHKFRRDIALCPTRIAHCSPGIARCPTPIAQRSATIALPFTNIALQPAVNRYQKYDGVPKGTPSSASEVRLERKVHTHIDNAGTADGPGNRTVLGLRLL
jgi:hypothetical protein